MIDAIETVDLTRRFGRVTAVDGLSLQVPAGSVFALIGANGAGKTTTMKLLMNLVRPTRGVASVLGIRSTHLNTVTLQRLGYVSENQRLPNYLSPQDLLDYCRPFYPTWDTAFAQHLQATLNLPMTTPLRVLSRGTRMKAALLSALAYRPDVLLLDEPFSGLDPLVREELVAALLELVNAHPCTILVSSHDIDEVERLCDWMCFLDAGRMVFAEQVSALLQRFRLVEVIGSDGAPQMVSQPAWIPQGSAGRTLRFLDTQSTDADGQRRLQAAFGAAEIRITALSLREIVVALARRSATAAKEGADR
jgi:ABC-2 type transport system ATP-binding protein